MPDILFTLLFAAHLLLVDVAIAGPLFCVWLDCRATRRGEIAASEIGRSLARRVVLAVVLGIGAGVTMWWGLSLLPDQKRYLEVFDAIPKARWWAIISELVFFVVAMGLYAGLWNKWTRYRWGHRLVAILAGTTLAFHFPPMFAMVSALSTRPELQGQSLDRPTYWHLMFDPETLARTTHHLLAAVAVVGTIVACKAARRCSIDDNKENSSDKPGTKSVGEIAARVALFATLLQIPVGIWVFLQLPVGAREQVLGTDPTSLFLFGGALISALGLLHHLAALAMGDLTCRQVYRAGILLVLTTVMMTGMLHRTRTAVFREMDRGISSVTPQK